MKKEVSITKNIALTVCAGRSANFPALGVRLRRTSSLWSLQRMASIEVFVLHMGMGVLIKIK